MAVFQGSRNLKEVEERGEQPTVKWVLDLVYKIKNIV